MSTTIQKSPKPDALTLVAEAVAKSEAERSPISRQMLSEMVHQETSLSAGEAALMVDEYCDENAPAVPMYLAAEFSIPYLKVIAVINVMIALGGYYWGIQVNKLGKQPAWPWFFVATIVVGFGVFAWVQSLEQFAARRRARR